MLTLDPATRTATMLLLLGALIASAALFHFATRLRRTIRRDELRFRLFAIRDRLYTAAREGNVDAQSAEFFAVRDVLNQVIRESDRAGGVDLVRLMAGPGLSKEDFMVHLPPKTRAILADTLAKTGEVLFQLFRLNSRVMRVMGWLAKRQPVTQTTGTAQSLETAVKRFETIREQALAA